MELLKYFPLVKVDERDHTVSGIATAEIPDADNEIADYEGCKAAYTLWAGEASASTKAAGQDPSYGNIRLQHGMDIGGKVVQFPTFDDANKRISLVTRPKNDEIWKDLKDGMYRGFSHAGQYQFRKCAVDGTDIARGNFCPTCDKNVTVRYAPILAEVSYVDSPCLKNATFTAVKADGTAVEKKFEGVESPITQDTEATLKEILARLNQLAPPINITPTAESQSAKAAAVKKAQSFLVVESDGTHHLPYTDEDGTLNHRLMGAAWASLHGGYRGNKYEGPDKDKAIAQLTSLYEKEGMETPAAKFTRVCTEAIDKAAVKLNLQKGMYEVTQVAQVLEQLAWIQQSALWERQMEDDDSTLPEEFLAVLEHAAQVFLHQVAEETGELTASAQAAMAAATAADAAETIKTSKGVTTMAKGSTNSFVKIFAPILGAEKAHSLAHHMSKMVKCVKEHNADGFGLHKAHHASMTDHLDKAIAAAPVVQTGVVDKSAGFMAHMKKAKECADGHCESGVEMHQDHADEMADHFGKLGKILGVEEADKWADEAADTPEEIGGEPRGAAPDTYTKGRKANAGGAPAPSNDDANKESFTKADVAEIVAATIGEFMKNLKDGLGAEPEPAPQTAQRSAGIGDRNNVRWPVSGPGGNVSKRQDTAASTPATPAGAAPAATEPTAEDFQKAFRGDPEALKKIGLGGPGDTLPPEVAYNMAMVGK